MERKAFWKRILGTVGRRLLPPADEAPCEPGAARTVFELTCKRATLKEELFRPCCVDWLLDFAKMHNIVQVASARLQNSVEAVDGREALLEHSQHEEAVRRRSTPARPTHH